MREKIMNYKVYLINFDFKEVKALNQFLAIAIHFLLLVSVNPSLLPSLPYPLSLTPPVIMLGSLPLGQLIKIPPASI